MTERSTRRRRRPANRAALVVLNGKQSLADTWSLQGNLYVRNFQQHHQDGNFANTERCSNSVSPEFQNHLCLEDDGFPRPSPVTTAFRDQFVVLDQSNNTIPCPPGSGNTCGSTPYGTLDRTATQATTVGASLQATSTGKLFDQDNHLVVGGQYRPQHGGLCRRQHAGFRQSRFDSGDQPYNSGERRKSSTRLAISASLR
jgi:hypothetical protein